MKANIQTFHSIWFLFRLTIIPKRKLSLFFLGIILVSAIGMAMGGYATAIQTKQYFLQNRPNVIVLYDKKASTPITGYIDESFVGPLNQISGVLTTSPEIYAAGLIFPSNEPVIAHGITPSFFNITPITLISGINPFVNSSKFLNAALVGVNLAETLSLEANETITFNSALKDASETFFIAGIFNSNSPADDELLIPLENARALGWAPSGFITLIEVKINNTIITKDKISSLFLKTFLNHFEIIPSKNWISYDPKAISAVISSTDNRILDKFYLNSSYFDLNLPFGNYTLTLDDFQTQYSQSYTFFSNQSSSLPIKLDFGPTFFTFNVRSIYNGSFLSNFNINIFDPYSHNEILNRSVINNASGSTFIFQGPRYYDIQVKFSDILRSQIIFLTQDMNITLDLDTGILLTLLNSTTNQFISGATIKAFDLNNNPLNPVVIFKDNSYRILLPPSKINLFVQKGVFNRTDTIIIPNTSPIPLQLYLGTVNVTLSAQTDVPVLANWTIIGGNSPIQKLNQFNIVFQAYSGTNYTIQIQYSNITDIFQLTPEQTISQTIFLKNNYSLTFQIINGTQENHTPLNNATIKLKSSSISKTLSTNSTGLANIIFQEMDVFNATIIYISSNGQVYTYSFLINSPNYYDRIIQIPLGMIRLVLNTTAIDNIPIPNENIILYLQRNNSISTISTHTNSTGQLDLLMPLVDSISITNGFFEYTFIINQSQIVQLSFLHIKTSSITFNVIDLNGVPIPNSQLQIIPISNLNLVEQIVIYTDNNGQAKISWPWGEYRIIATYQNIQHEETIVINANTNIFNLQFLFYLSSLGANDYLQINAFRNIQVSNPSQYANQFLQTTFTIFFVTILISVFIIVILSLFSLESIITFPIYQHRREIGTLRLLGTQPIDVSIGVSLKLALYSVVACIIGSICTEILTSTFLTIGSSNIGGFIFEPKFDLLISLLLFATVFISTFLISFIYMMRNITNKL